MKGLKEDGLDETYDRLPVRLCGLLSVVMVRRVLLVAILFAILKINDWQSEY